MDEFAYDTLSPESVRTRIQLYRNAAGDLVGFCTIHLFEIPIEKDIIGIIRTEAGLLPGYRGSGSTLWFGAKEAIRYKLLHPFRSVTLFATLVHPSSYHMLCKFLWRSYPYPGRKFPARWKKLLMFLIDWAGYEMVDKNDPLIRNVGCTTRESPEDAKAWQKNPHRDVQYYLWRNPNYSLGYGLSWIAPLSPSNLFMTAIFYLWHIASRWWWR